MACAACGNSILFGGKKSGSRKYCSQKCYDSDELGRISDTVAEADVEKLAGEMRAAECPSCKSTSSLEMHKSYFVYSVILYTSWKEKSNLLCGSCAKKQQTKDMLGSFFLGWWGIPFGLVVTPIILIMNGVALMTDPNKKPSSKALKERARLIIAHNMVASQKNV